MDGKNKTYTLTNIHTCKHIQNEEHKLKDGIIMCEEYNGFYEIVKLLKLGVSNFIHFFCFCFR